MKKILFALLFTLLFTGCIERGQNITPSPSLIQTPSKMAKPINKVKAIKTIKKSKNNPTVLKNPSKKAKIAVTTDTQSIQTTPIHVPQEKPVAQTKDTIFPLSEETKNKISGFFILLIGIMILI